MQTKIEVIRMHPENTNSVLVARGADAVIFDPWGRAEDWQKLLNERGLNLRAIYCTHGHPDHISAAPGLCAPWFMARADWDLIRHEMFSGLLNYFGLPHIDNTENLRDLTPGEIDLFPPTQDSLDAQTSAAKPSLSRPTGGQENPRVKITAIATPGHSAGGMTFYFPTENTLIIGDTLFQESIGRYDLPGGDAAALKKSIAKIYSMNLPDDTRVIHGHGMETTIGWLKENNSFFLGIGD
jgi:glyoxylase-like metal-dependent hydrolase (beta-lactamase superfamily II)